jgi:copper(I)-binding protein
MNNGNAFERLLGGTSDASNRFELHEMSMKSSVVKMRPVAGIEIKPGHTVELKADGYHVMFVGLKSLRTRPACHSDTKFREGGQCGRGFHRRRHGRADVFS